MFAISAKLDSSVPDTRHPAVSAMHGHRIVQSSNQFMGQRIVVRHQTSNVMPSAITQAPVSVATSITASGSNAQRKLIRRTVPGGLQRRY